MSLWCVVFGHEWWTTDLYDVFGERRVEKTCPRCGTKKSEPLDPQ